QLTGLPCPVYRYRMAMTSATPIGRERDFQRERCRSNHPNQRGRRLRPIVGFVGCTMIALLSVAQAVHGADERSPARQPGLAGFMAAASTESQPQTHYPLAAPVNCPYHFASTMPSFTYCVYRGVALDSDEQVGATAVVSIGCG